MKRILVATDLSARSDLAVERAGLLAKAHGATLTIAHTIDDDQSEKIVEAETRAASEVLESQARKLREEGGVECHTKLAFGEPFAGIIAIAREISPDLVVIGRHRSHVLKDVFIGTTAERTIRETGLPVLMVNAVPEGVYRHILVGVDLSPFSRDTVGALMDLGLHEDAETTVVHIYAVGPKLMRASAFNVNAEDVLAKTEQRVEEEVAAFLRELDFAPTNRVLRADVLSAGHVLQNLARELTADLIVVGTRGRSGLGQLFLGSVTQELLRVSSVDVLSVPPRRT